MGVLVRVTVPAPDDILRDLGAGALIHFERSATETGAYADTGLTKAVVTDTYSYEVFDPNGVESSWYRTWYTTSAGTTPSNRSDAFSPSKPLAYASLDDLLLVVPRPSDRSTDKIAHMEQTLIDARELIDTEIGVDFLRHPATGDETWIVDGKGGSLLHVHAGIISLAGVEVRDYMSAAWQTVDPLDWLLEPVQPPAGEPYFHVQLTGQVARGTWPRGARLVRFTGARGWAKPPRLAARGNVDQARLMLGYDATQSGGPVGPAEAGRPVSAPPFRLADAVWRLQRAHIDRFRECWT